MEKNIDCNISDLNNKLYSETEAKMLSPLQLAYIGDSVYEVLVRTYILSKNNKNVNELHKASVKFVKAKAQAEIVLNLEDKLTEEEWTLVKRGRNSKSATVPKNADLNDYKYATGFETLMGYLYLSGKYERINEIFSLIISNR